MLKQTPPQCSSVAARGSSQGAGGNDADGDAAGEDGNDAEGEGDEGADDADAEPPNEGGDEGASDFDPGEGEGEQGGGQQGGGDEGEGEGEGQGADEGEGEGEGEGEEGEGEEGEGEGLPDTEWGRCLVITRLQVGGDGFDLDGDGRADSALGAFGLFVNPDIARSFESGGYLSVLDIRGDNPANAEPFGLSWLTVHDADEDPRDNFSGREPFVVDARSFGADGRPISYMAEASIVGGILRGRAEVLAIQPVPVVVGGLALAAAPLRRARVRASFANGFDGLVDGLIGGAIREDDVRLAVDKMDLPAGTGEMLEGFLAFPDIDTDNDGVSDAFSIAWAFTATSCELLPDLVNP